MKKMIYSLAILLLPVLATAQYINIPQYTSTPRSTNLDGGSGCKAGIFPNPGNGLVKVLFSKDSFIDGSVIVYDLTGRLVYQKNHLNLNPVSLDISNLQPGMYTAIFTSGNKKERIVEKIAIVK